PCSGPYNLSGILYDSMFYSQVYSNPFFIAFGSVSYQYVYQDLYDEIVEMFQSPWDSMILRMLDRRNPESNLRDSLPVPGYLMFQPPYLAEVLSDSLHPLNAAIRDNDLYDWLPQAPVRLYYCTEDEQIPYINALFTAGHMAGLGADIDAVNAGPFDHFACTPFALINAKFWFDEYRTSCFIGTEVLADASGVQVFPNPFHDQFTVLLSGTAPGRLLLTDLLGRPVYDGAVRQEQQVALPADLPPGTYVIRLEVGGQVTQVKVVKE
ncbi:MAG: T9SS type A sorting domain-containing protein, partial [Bacteroidetes bacterium]